MVVADNRDGLEDIRERFQGFSEQELSRPAPECEEEEIFNRDGWEKCADFGVFSLFSDPGRVGSESSMLEAMYALEGLGYGCRDNGLMLAISAHLWGCQLPIAVFGSQPLKEKYLKSLCSGSLVGGHAVSEPEAGSDAFSLTTSAMRRDGDYVLNGTKTFVTNGTVADLVVVLARVEGREGVDAISAFAVERNTSGFRVTRKLGKMGLRSAEMAELRLEDCLVPVGSRIGPEGIGRALFARVMEWERACILAPAIGSMQYVLDESIRYAKNRVQFGRTISKQPEVARRIVNMRLRLETSRLLLQETGRRKDQGESVLMEASLAKLHVSESWVKNCLDAMAIHGGYGYLTEFQLERELRDALGSQFYSGTAEIQRLTAAGLMGL